MTRWSDPVRLMTILFCFLFLSAKGQDLFDEAHSRIYATHLFETGKYDLAAEEYGRLIRISKDDSLRILFLRANRLSNQPAQSLERVTRLMTDPANLSNVGKHEYIKLMLKIGAFSEAEKGIASLDTDTRYKYRFHRSLLLKDWEAADGIFRLKTKTNPEPADSQYSVLLTRAKNLPHRNPALAATMSVIIPGSGKIYSGEWKDGLIVFFFTAFSAYEAVSSFQIAGRTSIMGWIYTGLTVGFYSGGIYGSYKSAKRFNTRHEEEIIEDAKAIIFSTY